MALVLVDLTLSWNEQSAMDLDVGVVAVTWRFDLRCTLVHDNKIQRPWRWLVFIACLLIKVIPLFACVKYVTFTRFICVNKQLSLKYFQTRVCSLTPWRCIYLCTCVLSLTFKYSCAVLEFSVRLLMLFSVRRYPLFL